MTGNEFQNSAMRTMNTGLSHDEIMLNSTLGLNGEAGEVADAIKKARYQGHTYHVTHIKEELGDVLYYIATCAYAIGATLDEVMQMNVDKLKARYPDGFSEERSVNR